MQIKGMIDERKEKIKKLQSQIEVYEASIKQLQNMCEHDYNYKSEKELDSGVIIRKCSFCDKEKII